ncbi:MAG: disulfide bond formation protein DsbD [Cytophagaceae bacterium SCN 52-12]|nr:MAG: disulfide bond formation protein DsbD [Cytophagaceae bacterium SCN 52-12]
MLKIHSFLVFILLISIQANAQFQKHARFEFSTSAATVAAGDEVDLIFRAAIDKDWYLYSSDIDPDLGPTPTTVTFEEHPSFRLVGKLVPVGAQKKFDKIWEADITYFERRATFRQTVKILQKNPVIKGEIGFLTCNNVSGLCVPGDEEFTITGLQVSDAAPALPAPREEKISQPAAPAETAVTEKVQSPANTDTVKVPGAETVAPSPTDTVPAAGIKPESRESSESTSLWTFALTAFLAGLAALLTPCVFPVIPMTVTFFTKQSDGKRKALLYGSFIILIYTFIGVIVSRLNGPAFANFLSTHWIPNVFFFLVFFLFALSFLGMFEIVLPASLVNKMDSRADQGGMAGVFFMAFTLVLVSFSCTGPIAGSILVASAGGQVLKPIVGMISYSAAFAIPFTLFALFPDWLKKLPKSGGWLNTVKVVLGFLELALALKFLSIADQVYHWRILDREVFLAFWIVIFSFLGLYLLGKIRTPHDSPVDRLSVQRILLSILSFTFVVYMLPGMWGAPLKALAGYLPPQTTHDFDLGKIATRPGPDYLQLHTEPVKYSELFKLPHGLTGYFELQQGLENARKANKPVFIDFTGHGCVNCREMEARVWSHPEVLSRLKKDFVIVALYVDDKTRLPEAEWYTSSFDRRIKKTIGARNADIQIVRYNNNAQPYYCIVDHEGNLLVPPVDYDLDPLRFVSFLESGKKAFEGK